MSSGVRTPTGVTIGSTSEEVEAAYPAARYAASYLNPNSGSLIVENDQGDFLKFLPDESLRVAAIGTGSAPDISAPEGCA
jgi:hypothetical protein